MIDQDGYRPNVCMVIVNRAGQVFWAKRARENAWQFPQGGINTEESTEAALFRELKEETGLRVSSVDIIAVTKHWYRYRLPRRMLNSRNSNFVGQKQKWFLLRFKGDEAEFDLDYSGSPEFDDWQWVSYWYPVSQIVGFKKNVYIKAMKELAPSLNKCMK
jgi:putative (di)nucleoside polyphosphate hydrolase